MTDEDKDGCELDFTADVTKPEDVEALLVPAGEEQDSDDA
jgi:hypothetical protein